MFGLQRIWETRFEYHFIDGSLGNGRIWQDGGYWLGGISIEYIFPKKKLKNKKEALMPLFYFTESGMLKYLINL
jgi:hypothetical protein